MFAGRNSGISAQTVTSFTISAFDALWIRMSYIPAAIRGLVSHLQKLSMLCEFFVDRVSQTWKIGFAIVLYADEVRIFEHVRSVRWIMSIEYLEGDDFRTTVTKIFTGTNDNERPVPHRYYI